MSMDNFYFNAYALLSPDSHDLPIKLVNTDIFLNIFAYIHV